MNEKLSLNNYMIPFLRYKAIQSSLLIQPKQFIDHYTILGYIGIHYPKFIRDCEI